MKARLRIPVMISVLLLLVYCGISAFFQEISVVYALIFLLFQTFGILTVGYAVLKLIDIENLDFWETFGISYAFGYAFNIILYLIVFPLYGKTPLIISLYCISILSFIYLIKSGHLKQICRLDRKKKNFVYLFLLFVLLFQFFVSAANNMSPGLLGFNTYYRDSFYWAGDIVSLSKKFPPEDYRIIGAPYYYHYFSSMQGAVVCMCTGIPINGFVFGFSFVQSAILLVCAAYCFFKTVLRKPSYIAFGMILALFTTGDEQLVRVTIISHLFTSPFGYDVGTAFGLLTMAFWMKQIKEVRFNWRLFAAILICFFTCVGTKGPIGAIVLLMIGVTCVCWVLIPKKRNLVGGFVYGSVLLSLFLKLYILVVSGPIGGAASKAASFVGGGTGRSLLADRPELISVYSVTSKLPIVGEFVFSLFYVLKAQPAVFVLFCAAVVLLAVNYRKTDVVDIITLCGFITGVILTRALKLGGYSQMYFIMAGIPYGIGFSLKVIEEFMEGDFLKVHSKMKRIQPIGAMLLLLIGSWYFVCSNSFFYPMESGLTKIISVISGERNQTKYMVYNHSEPRCDLIADLPSYENGNILITEKEYEAALWIKSNTEDYAIITANLQKDTMFYQYPFGIIGERRIWKKDNQIITDAAQGDEQAIEALIDEDVDYFLTFAENKETILNILEASSIVYENEEVIIVKLS